MRKVHVLFFAADPHSQPPEERDPRLRLDEDLRTIREKVRMARHRDALDFDVWWAARTDDLLQALNEKRPKVVHFSGHGGKDGLVLVSADGLRPHPVSTAALAKLFDHFGGEIRLAVLNACFSYPQAEAIAGAVGCAIGTHGKITDSAAITFGAAFYRAIAFGKSVKKAYDEAATALLLEHVDDRDCPELVVRPGVDPAKLYLVPRWPRRLALAAAGLALASAAAVVTPRLVDRVDPSPPTGRDSVAGDTTPLRTDTSSPPATKPASEQPRVAESKPPRTRPSPTSVAPQPADDRGQTVGASRGSVSPPVILPVQSDPDFAHPTDTLPNRTMAPARPPR